MIKANSNLSFSISNNDRKKSVTSILKSLLSNHQHEIIIGHINIDSIRYKFDTLKPMRTILETKLDDSFPKAPVYIESFRTTFRLDHNKHGGGILL